ncbi:regulatory ArsR family protein [Streptohalobacillus salinus]|uniref:Regulatory ArsR family protein n=1 Tax=Streptohalobacillus salinus TaxID=621096 RepID=A0A2V3WHR3_9BACI|nr:metalloregulator ArsR/SmtB family transcription factor [Streptohalobacillus salinus]PXW93117.1 regulatory ArsR family protein [Streptohalobacillus salinus]
MTDYQIRDQEVLNQTYQIGLKQYQSVENDQARKAWADFYKALADETRLKIITFLSQGPACLCELVDALSVANSTLTHHLQLLDRGGLIEKKKQGRFTIYQLNQSDQVNSILTTLSIGG